MFHPLLHRVAAGLVAAVPAHIAGAESETRNDARRDTMVDQQIAARNIKNPDVLHAMRTVPRERFVPEGVRDQAFEDHPLPIGHGQTISQPFIVAFMCDAAKIGSSDKVLEIGTGSGYHAAVMAELANEVYSIEIVPPLAQRAKETLATLGYSNVFVRSGDGYKGWPEEAPFDAIVVTCAPEAVPEPLIDQLAEGGRLIIPVGDQGDQSLVLIHKEEGRLTKRSVLPVRFVPMTRHGNDAN